MKTIIFALLLSSTVLAYDGRIKDNYGRTVSYIKVDDNSETIKIYDNYGRKYMEVDSYFEFKDDSGNKKGSIKWND